VRESKSSEINNYTAAWFVVKLSGEHEGIQTEREIKWAQLPSLDEARHGV
jgi:hypothetical protein